MASDLILASGSAFRRSLLENAGVVFRAVSPQVDERAVEAALSGSDVTPEDVALVLAEAKADTVSTESPQAWVIGCDQTLSLGDRLFHKPGDMDEARHNLLALSGKTHQLNSAIALVRSGVTVWRYVSVAHMTMRTLPPSFIGRYLSQVGEAALSSVGSYQIEAAGIQLFEKVEGDFFAIVGLPLLPLLKALRDNGAIDG